MAQNEIESYEQGQLIVGNMWDVFNPKDYAQDSVTWDVVANMQLVCTDIEVIPHDEYEEMVRFHCLRGNESVIVRSWSVNLRRFAHDVISHPHKADLFPFPLMFKPLGKRGVEIVNPLEDAAPF
jgi:hypothetical protein